MDDDNHKHSGQYDAALPLPGDDTPKSPDRTSSKHEPDEPKQTAAADLIRKRVTEAYSHEPALKAEAEELKELESKTELSKHQQFILDLTSSGKPLSDIQAAWHEYYAALPDPAKHEVWQEFYSLNKQAEAAAKDETPHGIIKSAPLPSQAPSVHIRHTSQLPTTASQHLQSLRSVSRTKLGEDQGRSRPLHSLLFGLGVGCIVLVVFLFSFFNERFIAPFIQPSRNATNTPIISGSVIGSNPEIIIPKINVEIPVVYGVSTISESDIDSGLENGVVHYADTPLPGQNGNLVIVGHSSNNIFNPGKYKFAFVLLNRLETGDTFYLQKDGKRYTYQIYKKNIVKPTDISVLGPTDKPATASLITCDPPGTSANRLVVVGEQIDPSPDANTQAVATANKVAREAQIIPGNAPTLWSRLVKWLES